MRRVFAVVIAGLVLLPLARAGDEGVAGHWKVTLVEDGNQLLFWLVHLERNKDGKLTGAADSLSDLPPTDLSDLQITGDVLQFNLKLRKGPTFAFEGRLPKAGAKKIFGSLSRTGRINPAVLEATAATNVTELHQEILIRTPYDPRAFDSAFFLFQNAKENKAAAKDAETWAAAALKSAEVYGPRMTVEVSLRLADALMKQRLYPELAAEIVQKAEGTLEGNAALDAKLRVLSALTTALRQGKQLDKAKEADARLDKLIAKDYQEYSAKILDYKLAKFAGRKAKTDRVAVLELFTGAQCPPCVAADLAFDGALKTYSPKDVVFLQYHLHIPRPDPLTNPDTEARAEYYGEAKVPGTPAVLFNGAAAPLGGGGKEDAGDFYEEYRKRIDATLETEAGVQLSASAVRKGEKIDIKVQVKDLAKPSDKMKLRLALVEDVVRYKGMNGLAYHHRVVREMPGGAGGVTLPKKDLDHSATVDLEELAKKLSRYLDEFAKNEAPFHDDQRPMRLRDLSVVAFVQNDANQEVLQAVNVEVKAE